jgi:hypothetical protein
MTHAHDAGSASKRAAAAARIIGEWVMNEFVRTRRISAIRAERAQFWASLCTIIPVCKLI